MGRNSNVSRRSSVTYKDSRSRRKWCKCSELARTGLDPELLDLMVRLVLDLTSTWSASPAPRLVSVWSQLGAHRWPVPRDGPACARSGRVLTRTVRVSNDLPSSYEVSS